MCLPKGGEVTFHVREIVWKDGRPESNALLPMVQETWSDAVNHIRSRQRVYDRRGYDEKGDEWWAILTASSVVRWTIEEDDDD
jgi:hypothetical protein